MHASSNPQATSHRKAPGINLQPIGSRGLDFGSWVFRGSWILGLGSLITLYLFDPSFYGFYPRCLFHETTGLLCPGCGCLRAMHQLLHGHFVSAFQFNPLFVISLPVIAGLAARAAARKNPTGLFGVTGAPHPPVLTFGGSAERAKQRGMRASTNMSSLPGYSFARPVWMWAVLGVIIAFTILRNIPGSIFATLPRP